jgi:hypothetical protein
MNFLNTTVDPWTSVVKNTRVLFELPKGLIRPPVNSSM